LNPIAERFGLYFRYDATYGLRDLDLSLYRPPALFAHPIVRNLASFLFATSCTLDSPLLSENVILGYGLRSMHLDYSETSYFPTKAGKVDYLFGVFVQAGGVRFGKGRVLAFTDSTCFSNFFMFMPGKPELARASLDWLNRKSGSRLGHLVPLGVGFIGLALVAWVLAGRRRADLVPRMVGLSTLTFVATAAYSERAGRAGYPGPNAVGAIEEVVFDAEHGDFFLPAERLLGPAAKTFHTFYVWTQRLGLVPRVVEDMEEAWARPARVLVEVSPVKEFALAEIDGLFEFVRQGGVLLVIDTPENEASTANQLLGSFQMRFGETIGDTIAVVCPTEPVAVWIEGTAPGDTLGVVPAASAVVGGKPLLMADDGTVVMAVREVGAGRVVAFGAARLFSNEVMGTTAVVPDRRQRSLYQAEYDLFETIAGVRATRRYTAGSTDAGE
jgi:hypothetical protein